MIEFLGSVAIDTDEFPEDHFTMDNGAYIGSQNTESMNNYQ